MDGSAAAADLLFLPADGRPAVETDKCRNPGVPGSLGQQQTADSVQTLQSRTDSPGGVGVSYVFITAEL